MPVFPRYLLQHRCEVSLHLTGHFDCLFSLGTNRQRVVCFGDPV
jgi:hypothetical protein